MSSVAANQSRHGSPRRGGARSTAFRGATQTWRLAAALVALSTGTALAQIGFVSGPPRLVPSAPTYVAAADFDGDGIADAAVTSADEDYVTLLLGSSDAAFSSVINVPVEHGLADLVADDFDGDGFNDLALVAPARNFVTVLYGFGDGTFVTVNPPEISVLGRPVALARSDLDHQNGLDLVTVDQSGDHFSILHNLGARNGLEVTGYSFTGDRPQAIALADFNNDGFDDAVALDTGSTGTDDVAVALNNGFFGFSGNPVIVPVAPGGLALTTADFNGDGAIDIAVLNGVPGNPTSFSIVVLQNNTEVFNGQVVGTGIFHALDPLPLACVSGRNCTPVALEQADFDGDGHMDLAVSFTAGAATPGFVSVYAGKGDGTFTLATQVDVGLVPQEIAAADVTGDGVMDLVVAESGSDTVRVLRGVLPPGASTPSPTPTPSVPTATVKPISLVGLAPQSVPLGAAYAATADLNLDDIPDVILGGTSENFVESVCSSGGASLSSAIKVLVGVAPRSLITLDINGDSYSDIAVVDTGLGRVFVVVGKGDCTFFTPFSYLVPHPPVALASGDFDAINGPDVVTADKSGDAFAVLLNRGGNRGFQLEGEFATGSKPVAVATADLNGDGFDDVVTVNSGNSGADDVAIALSDGSGSFAPIHLFAVGLQAIALTIGDFNGDLAPDIAVLNDGGANPPSLSILLNRTTDGETHGTGFFSVAPPLPLSCPPGVNCTPVDIQSADLNGDGFADLAIVFGTGASTKGFVQAFSGRGDGRFELTTQVDVGTDPGQMAIADFTGDGASDILVTESAGAIRILDSRAHTPTRTPTATPTVTRTATPTQSPTRTATATVTRTPTRTASPSQTPTSSPSSTPSRSATATATLSPTPTVTATATPTSTATRTQTETPTRTASQTPTPSATQTGTFTPTHTATATPSRTDAPTRTSSATASASPTATPTPTSTATDFPTSNPTPTPTPTSTATRTETKTPSAPPTTTASITPSASPSATAPPTPTATAAEATPTASPSATPACAGDCDAVGPVTIAEVQRVVNVFLQTEPLMDCPNADRDHSTTVTIDEVQAAVNSFLSSPADCPKVDAL